MPSRKDFAIRMLRGAAKQEAGPVARTGRATRKAVAAPEASLAAKPQKSLAAKATPAPAKKSAVRGAEKAAPDFSTGFGTFAVGPTKIIWEKPAEGGIDIVSLRTPSAKRGQGFARSAMETFLAETDAQGLPVTLGASPLDKRTKSGKLVNFYKSLGFEPTGQKINTAGDPEMARSAAPSAALDTPPLAVAAKAAPEASLAVPTKKSSRKVPAAAAPVNPVTLIDREYGPAMARRVAEYVDSDAPVAEWRDAAKRFTEAGSPNYVEPRPSAYSVKPAEVVTDPRIEKRKKEQQKIRDLELEIQPRALEEPPIESIYDLEGRGLLTTMSDLSAAGDDVLAVNNVRLRRPFSRQGGQGFMFENPGEVWAADTANAKAIQAAAAGLEKQTGKPAILAPFTMGPLSSMFSHHPRGLQYAYADAALDAPEKAMLAENIRRIIPEWTDFSDPDAYMTFMRAAGKRRGQLNKLMDQFRDRGGLGTGEAVYGTTDLDQLGAPMLALRNLGEVDTRFGLSESKNPAYSAGVPGQGRAKLKEENLGALSLFPELMAQYGYRTPFDFPVGVNKGVASPLRAFQLKPQPTIITDKVLRYLDDLRAQGLDTKP